MNIELLREVQSHIKQDPKSVNMPYWIENYPKHSGLKVPKCGTVACIGGWAELLSGMNPAEGEAARLLGIEHVPGAANRLFLEHRWPYKFRSLLDKHEPQTKAYAKVVSDRIDHFIATKGAE